MRRTPQAFRPGLSGSLESLEPRQLLASSLQISGTPAVTVAEGKTATVTYTITNTATTAATGVLFYSEPQDAYGQNEYIAFPSQPFIGPTQRSLFAISSVTTSLGVTSASPTSVALGSLAAGASTTLTVVITAGSAGTDALLGAVGSDQQGFLPYTPGSGAQIAATSVTITGQPDLGVVSLPPSGTAQVGVPFTFPFVVTNHDTAGFIEAGYLVSSAAIVQGVTATSSTPNSPVFAGLYYGVLGTLQAGQSENVSVTVIPKQPGPVVVEFATSSASIDSAPEANAANNVAIAGTPAIASPVVTNSFLSPATGNIQYITLDFAAPLVASTADRLGNYKVTTVVGTKSTAISLKFVTYDPKANRVVLGLKKPQPRAGQPLTVTLSGLLAVGGGGLVPGDNVVTLTR
jgi:hypothetical protein